MGEYAVARWIQILAWIVAAIILSLNVKLVFDQISSWISDAGEQAWTVQITVLPVVAYLGFLLVYVIVQPWVRERREKIGLPRIGSVHRQPVANGIVLPEPAPYKRIAVALDFSGKDEKLLAESLRFIDKTQTQLSLLHVVESPVARTLGEEAEDKET